MSVGLAQMEKFGTKLSIAMGKVPKLHLLLHARINTSNSSSYSSSSSSSSSCSSTSNMEWTGHAQSAVNGIQRSTDAA